MPTLKLGLVCISEILRDRYKHAFKTMTRQQFNKHPRDVAIQILSARTLENAEFLVHIIKHCAEVGISHYRVSSCMFPLITDPTLNLSVMQLPDAPQIVRALQAAGDLARATGVSCSSHPDQYNVLCSYNPNVIENTIDELNHQSRVLDMMGFARDYSTPMCLHLNCSPKLQVEHLHDYRIRFFESLARCSPGVQRRLVLENEDKGYWNCEQLFTLFGEFIPLVYDNLHDTCNPSSDDWTNSIQFFRQTWLGFTPVFHWSEGIEGSNRHTKRASYIPGCVKNNTDVIWEVELKDKDYAIAEILSMDK